MSEDIVKSEGQHLFKTTEHDKSHDRQKLIDNLTRLKKDLKCSKMVLQQNQLGHLIKQLKHKDIETMSLILSILADACLTSDVRHKMEETEIVTRLLQIVQNSKVGNVLLCRTYRLIRNLCKSSHFAKSFYDAGIVENLALTLSKPGSKSTNIMALGVARHLWQNCNKSRKELLKHNIIYFTMQILEGTIKESNPEAHYRELSEACLKAMLVYLSTQNEEVGMQLRGSKDDLGYRTLIKYCKSHNKLALKCMYRLCQIAECRPHLGKHDAVTAIVELISKEETFSYEAIACLCLLCREAVNRYRVRVNYGLEQMLNLLKHLEYENYHSLVLHALTNFVHDSESIGIMLKNGLVDVIMDKLRVMSLKTYEDDDEENEEKGDLEDDEEDEDEEQVVKKRRTDSFNLEDVKQNMLLNRYSSDFCRYDWNFRTSSCSYSPPSLYAFPTISSDRSSEDYDNAEENVSSISENELNDNEETEDNLPVNVTEDLNSGSTLTLLTQLSHLKEPVDKLADPCLIEPLVSYIKNARNSKALHILKRIAGNSFYLIPLIKQGFVFQVQTMYGSKLCTEELRNLATTGGAIGELTQILLQGQETHKYITAVSIPFLITSKYTLRNLLSKYGGLPLIFQVLGDREHDLFEKAICSICQLADSLEIRPETIEKPSIAEDIAFVRNSENIAKSSIVTFVLDDGTTVDACRRTLCRRSDAFTAMLEGEFLESGKKRVKLRNTSKGGLETLLLALDGTAFEHNAIESLLDAALLADKFLMSSVSHTLTESSISKLSYKNYSRAWNWARKNACHELKSCCVKSFLTTKMTRSQRIRAFHDFSNSENFAEFLDEIREIISTELCQS